MGLFDLNAKIKFTTDCVRYNSAHFIAMWWVNEDGTIWTDKTNQTPYLWLVRKGTGNNYNLREATNFDINLQVQNIFTPQYNCRIHAQCNNHKLRIMIIPICKVSNLSSYGQFANAFTNASTGGTNDGDYFIERLDNNSSYSSAYSSFSTHLMEYVQNTLLSSSQRSFGESIIDIDVVNSAMKNCINREYQLIYSSNIVTGSNSDTYTICGSELSSGNLILPSYKLFPDPVDNSTPISGFTFNTSTLKLRFCHKSLSTTGEIHEYGLDTLDNQQYPLVDCCNTYELFNVSVASTNSQSFKYFIFYQDADPASSTFLQFVNRVIKFGDSNYYSSINSIKAIPGSLYIVKKDDLTNTGLLTYESSTSNKNFSTTISNGLGNDTLTVTKGGISKIQCT
jgi:hypothetical protein